MKKIVKSSIVLLCSIGLFAVQHPFTPNQVAQANTKQKRSTEDIPVEKIAFSFPEKQELVSKQTIQLLPIITPENATNKEIVYTSSDDEIASVDEDGKVVAKSKGGFVTITGKSKENEAIKDSVTFLVNPVESLDTPSKPLIMELGQTVKLDAKVNKEAYDQTLRFTIGNAAIISGKGNQFTGKKVGKTTIIVSANGATNVNGDTLASKTIEVEVRSPVLTKKLVKSAGQLKGIKLSLTPSSYTGILQTSIYQKGKGWQGYVDQNVTSKTNLLVEGLKIKLTAQLAKQYDVYYQVYIQGVGWTDWGKNNQQVGYKDSNKKILDVNVKLQKKGVKFTGKTAKIFFYTKTVKPYTKIVRRLSYPTYKEPYNKGVKRAGSIVYADWIEKFTITGEAVTPYGKYYKIQRKKQPSRWIHEEAFFNIKTDVMKNNYKMKAYRTTAIYSHPFGAKEAKKIGSLKKNTKIQGLERGYLSDLTAYVKISYKGKNGYVQAESVDYDLNHLKGSNKKVEKTIATGMKHVHQSPYLWGGGRTAKTIAQKRFDCSSFVHYMYKSGGKTLGNYTGATTYTLKNYGKKVSSKKMKRGDMIFFSTPYEGLGTGSFSHVGIYLGDGFFLHDSPGSDTGGVGINRLDDPRYKGIFNHYVKRIL